MQQANSWNTGVAIPRNLIKWVTTLLFFMEGPAQDAQLCTRSGLDLDVLPLRPAADQFELGQLVSEPWQRKNVVVTSDADDLDSSVDKTTYTALKMTVGLEPIFEPLHHITGERDCIDIVCQRPLDCGLPRSRRRKFVDTNT